MSAKDAVRRPDALRTGHLEVQKREMCALEFIPNLGFSFEIGGSHQRTPAVDFGPKSRDLRMHSLRNFEIPRRALQLQDAL